MSGVEGRSNPGSYSPSQAAPSTTQLQLRSYPTRQVFKPEPIAVEFIGEGPSTRLFCPVLLALVDHAPEPDVRNGCVAISDRPGLGVKLVEDRVRPYLWAKI
jgi:hypothetical protein